MDLKTEEIIKILLILGVLYLLFNCVLTENFADEIIRIKLALLSDGKAYRLVSFHDLKDEYKIVLLSELYSQYKLESSNNDKESDAMKKTDNSFFLFGGKENELINIFDGIPEDKIKENIEKIKENAKKIDRKLISKTPVIIVSNDKVSDYTNSIFDFAVPTEKDKGLVAESGKFLFWNKAHKLMFYSANENLKFEIKGLHKNTDKNKLEIDQIKHDDKDITPSKLSEKTIKLGDLTFTHYVLSNDEGKDFAWKWYTDDLSKIL